MACVLFVDVQVWLVTLGVVQERAFSESLKEERQSREKIEAKLSCVEREKIAVEKEMGRWKEQVMVEVAKNDSVQKHVQELETRCEEAEKLARLATRSSSKELNLAQVKDGWFPQEK